MGLAGPRKRRKIAQDPNNTHWSRSESGYGQKILSAQGWTPGSYLGAKDAPQSSHYSSANASHIRVLLKDDNLGLGANRGAADAPNFGLSSLQDLYGRLNGKSDTQLQKEEQYRADVNRTLYADRKWGALRFVSGGVLVGDTIEREPPSFSSGSTTAPLENPVLDLEEPEIDGVAQGSIRESHSRKQSNKDSAARKERKKKTKQRCLDHMTAQEVTESSDQPNDIGTESRAERKARRRQRKLDKKALATAEEDHMSPVDDSSDVALGSQSLEKIGHISDEPNERPSNPRLAVRQRFIKQKRMSSMNPQALREILMLKS